MIGFFSKTTRPAARTLGLLTTALLAFSCSSEPGGGLAPGAVDEDGGSISNFVVTDSSRFVVRGPEGGPFPTGDRDYTFTNTGSAPARWETAASEPWILFSNTSGIVPPGGVLTLTVSLDGNFAATLPVGDYPAEIVFGEPGQAADIVLYFLLKVQPVEGGGHLAVTPSTGFEPEGNVGGPVTPDSQIYTVQNTGNEALDWAVTSTENWLQLSSPNNGTLQPGGSASFLASVDLNAVANFGPGTRTANMRFENQTNGAGSTEIGVTMTLNSVNSGGRVTDDLVFLYDFAEGTGNQVTDVSGSGGNLDLTIANPSNTSWGPEGLTIHSPTVISSNGPATQMANACSASNEVTLEAWVDPANLTQDGPARILSMSNGVSSRNFTIGQGLWSGQPSAVIDVRLRSTATDLDGLPSLTSNNGSMTDGSTHVVYTRASNGTANIYINGTPVAVGNVGGNLSNWDGGYSLLLGNEPSGDRPWLGTIHLGAGYSRALSPAEVEQNFLAGPGNIDAGRLVVSPSNGFFASGNVGGPFSPSSQIYTLSNAGTVPIDWEATGSDSWFNITGATSGTLQPGAQRNVTVRLSENLVESFSSGSYHGNLSFVNLTDGFGSVDLDVTLSVSTPGAGGLVITPGSGFNGPTPPPGQVGSGPGSDATSIARWDVVPYQDFTGDFNVGVIAFHMNQIDRVEFSCEGGPWTAVSEMTLNSRTGVVEYWGTLPADGFSSDGLKEVRAIAYPLVGRPRLLDTLYLNCNVNNTMPAEVRWVSPSGSSGGNGSQSSPFRTIWQAALDINSDQGGNAGGGKIYLLPGTYDLPGQSQGPGGSRPTTTTRWLTVQGAPGTTRDQILINGSDYMLTKRMKLQSLTIRTTTSVSSSIEPEAWAHDVEMHKEGSRAAWESGASNDYATPILRGIPGNFYEKVYQTSCHIHDMRDNNYRTTIQRNCLIENLARDCFYNPQELIVNCTLNGIAGSNGVHPDMIQLQGPTIENLIFYNVQALNAGAQGIFAKDPSGYPTNNKDIAFVNVVIDNEPHFWSSQWKRSVNHLLLWHVTTPYQLFRFRQADYPQNGPVTLSNVSIRNCIFNYFQGTSSIVHQDNNHYMDISQSSPVGTNVTSGGSVPALFTAADAPLPDFDPLPSSPLVNRVTEILVPVDAKGNERSFPASIGAID